jgi:hypothetical protein
LQLPELLRNLLRRRAPESARETLERASALLAAGRFEEAARALDRPIARSPGRAELLHLRGVAIRKAGRPLDACSDLVRASALAPQRPDYLFDAALAYHALGDDALALEYCQRARSLDPAFEPPYQLQARIALGGESYYALLERIHGHLKPRTYLEIGVSDGRSLELARAPTLAIGIDPEPKLAQPPAPNQRVFAETSDAFFANHDVREELGGLPVDLAFIDGMHHFEYALRDFASLERCCARESVVMIHDCYPLDRETAERTRLCGFWSGDVWRLIVLLKKYRPDLAIDTVGAPPTGLALVRNLDPDSTLLRERYEALRDEFLGLDYAYLETDKAGKLNLFPNQWKRIEPLLQG